MTGEELNILSKIKVRPVEEQRDYLLEQNMLLTGKIATLKKENAKLKEQITELEKENAELKEKLNFRTQYYQGEKAKDQLTKAKEHIRTLISCLIDWVQEGDKDYCYIADAEQFIKEIEK